MNRALLVKLPMLLSQPDDGDRGGLGTKSESPGILDCYDLAGVPEFGSNSSASIFSFFFLLGLPYNAMPVPSLTAPAKPGSLESVTVLRKKYRDVMSLKETLDNIFGDGHYKVKVCIT